jgi:hypothetical protein
MIWAVLNIYITKPNGIQEWKLHNWKENLIKCFDAPVEFSVASAFGSAHIEATLFFLPDTYSLPLSKLIRTWRIFIEHPPKTPLNTGSDFVEWNSSTQNAFSGWVAILLSCQQLRS